MEKEMGMQGLPLAARGKGFKGFKRIQRVVVAASPQFTASFHRKEVSPQATEDRGVNSFEKGS